MSYFNMVPVIIYLLQCYYSDLQTQQWKCETIKSPLETCYLFPKKACLILVQRCSTFRPYCCLKVISVGHFFTESMQKAQNLKQECASFDIFCACRYVSLSSDHTVLSGVSHTALMESEKIQLEQKTFINSTVCCEQVLVENLSQSNLRSLRPAFHSFPHPSLLHIRGDQL